MAYKAEPEPFMTSSVEEHRGTLDNGFLAEKDKVEPVAETRLSAIFEKFCNTTSMHGCGQISGSHVTTGRLVWSILTLGAVAGLMFHLYSIFHTYYKWPIQTKVSLGFDNLKYPAITLCNTNKVRRSALFGLHDMKPLKDLADLVDPDSVLLRAQRGRTSLQNSSDINNVTETNITNFSGTNLTSDGAFSNMYGDINLTTFDSDVYSTAVNETADDDWDTQMDPLFLIEDVFQTVFFNIDRTKRAEAGHDISQMLISCTFDGHTCYPENFTLWQTSSHGNCWTLSTPKLVAKTTGSRSGLSLILFLQTDEFIAGLTNGFGMKMIIHDRGAKPLPQDEGMFIAAASETSIGLVQKSIVRLDGNYGDCNDGIDFEKEIGIRYSRQTCQVVCNINEVLKTCGCYGSYYEEIALNLDENAKVCNKTKDKICMNRVRWNLKQKKKFCHCDNPCREIVYEKSVSARQWPTKPFAKLLLEGVCEKDPTSCGKMRSQDRNARDLANNFVKLNVYYETLNYELIEEEPLIDVYQFLASIGGSLGLWIGLSLLSFCEIVQLIGDVLEYLIERCRHRTH